MPSCGITHCTADMHSPLHKSSAVQQAPLPKLCHSAKATPALVGDESDGAMSLGLTSVLCTCTQPMCSLCIAGRDSPDLRSESTSPEHQGRSQASGLVSQSNGPGYSQNGLRESQDDGQAEDLVSDVHARAQSTLQAAVAAGLDQQQKVQPYCPVYLPFDHTAACRSCASHECVHLGMQRCC